MFSTVGCTDFFACPNIEKTDSDFYPCMRHCYLVVDPSKDITTCEQECHDHGSSTVCMTGFFYWMKCLRYIWGYVYLDACIFMFIILLAWYL
jgi:hypothetical protein